MHRLKWNIQFNVCISWAKYVNKIFCLWLVLCWTGNLEHNSHYIWWAILRFFGADQHWHDDVIKWKRFPRYWSFVGEFTRHRGIPLTKTSDAELWCFFDLLLNKRLSKQSWGWWFETLSRLWWRLCNGFFATHHGRLVSFGRCDESHLQRWLTKLSGSGGAALSKTLQVCLVGYV